MNWEKSRALTPLKRDFIAAFFAGNQTFFLTGGSALGVFYLDHRLSHDLDFFTTEGPVDWHVMNNEILSIAARIGASCETLTASPTFRRYRMIRGADIEILDFVVELAPQIDPEKARFGPVRVDTLREITVNKICTLLGRSEVKDVVDLYYLAKRGWTLRDHLAQAQCKEGGLNPAVIAYLLADIRIDDIPAYVLDPLEPESLRAFISSLRTELANMAYPG